MVFSLLALSPPRADAHKLDHLRIVNLFASTRWQPASSFKRPDAVGLEGTLATVLRHRAVQPLGLVEESEILCAAPNGLNGQGRGFFWPIAIRGHPGWPPPNGGCSSRLIQNDSGPAP